MNNRIKELRTERGLRQKDLAEKLGVSPQTVGYYENWVNKPDPETLIKLADIFEVSIDYLLGRENEYGVISLNANNDYSADERQLISDYRSFSKPAKELAHKMFCALKDLNESK